MQRYNLRDGKQRSVRNLTNMEMRERRSYLKINEIFKRTQHMNNFIGFILIDAFFS